MEEVESWAERLKAEGRAEGGLATARRLLARLVEVRFGVPDARLQRLIDEAEIGQIEAWSLRLLNANSPEELFGETGPL